jgi:hypothetical protein
MNVSSARKGFSRRILFGVAGLIFVAAPLTVTAAAADPYQPPDDTAAYQAYTGRGQYGQPMPPPGQYLAPVDYAQRNQLEERLNYAEEQYERAQQAGDRGAAKHWRKQIKHLRRELSGEGHQEGPGYGSGYGTRDYLPPQGPYGPPVSAYGPQYTPPGAAYTQPYPPAGYPPTGYPNAGSPYSYGTPGAPGQTGSMGGLSSLLGPLLGGGGAPSAAPYGGYPQAGYPNAGAGSPYGAPGAAGQMGGLGSLLGPLLGGQTAP